MRLDRNIGETGKGKYALVRLRTIEAGSEAHELLERLDALGVLDWGKVGTESEFFVLKLRDKFSGPAIAAYADAVASEVFRQTTYDRTKQLSLYAIDVLELCKRAGILSPFCKEPD